MLTLELSFALVDSLRTAEHVTVLTGAGISAESGVPTFREAQSGLWAKYDPTTLATPEAFERNPQLVWEWYAWRRSLVTKALPNAGHLALVNMARRAPQFSLITQNVDNLHQRAGSREVIELHGNLGRVRCSRENVVIDEWPPSATMPPRCPQCGAPLRPDVVWFGEALPSAPLSAAFTAAQACDIFFSIGTSGMVHPAAALPYTALERGAIVVEINPTETALTPYATHHLSGPAGELLPLLYNAAWNSH